MVVRKGWEKRHSEMATKIELAALQLLFETGDDDLAMQVLADRIGISRRTFYRYYPSAHHALVAAPLRSLARISEDVRQRPESESLRTAFMNAFNQAQPSEASQLIARIAATYPLVWRRVIAQMQPTSVDFFEVMVSDRLRRSGRDTRLARLVAGVLVSVIENQQIALDTMVVFAPLEEPLVGVMELLRL